MNIMVKTAIVGGALAFALSGCASIVEGTTQSIAVTTPPTDGAKCVLTSSEGTYYVTTPGNVIVHKTKNSLKAECKKDGFDVAEKTIEPHFNGATAGNIIAGGIIGIGIDAATGANYNYPKEVAVDMTATGSTPPVASVPAAAVVPATSAPAKPTT